MMLLITLASGIDVGQKVNVGPGKFGKKNECKDWRLKKKTKVYPRFLIEKISEITFFRLFPIISISQKIFSIFFLTLEKIGLDEKVIC